MVHLLIWNRAHDDMFSKSSALPRHSFQEESAQRKGRKRDSVCECGRGSRWEISRVFCEWSSPTGQSVQLGPRIHADGVSSDTNCCDREGERAGSSMAHRPSRDWSTLGPRPAICFFCVCVCSFSVFPSVVMVPPLTRGQRSKVKYWYTRPGTLLLLGTACWCCYYSVRANYNDARCSSCLFCCL